MLNSWLDSIIALAEKRDADEAQARGISVDELKSERLAASLAFGRQQDAEAARILAIEHANRRSYGESIGLGVAAHIGHIIKLSGLSERSMGNGWSKGTVWHIVLDESLDRGRLKRMPGDLLCKPRSALGSRSMGITGTDENCGRSDSSWNRQSVTCPQCLRIISKSPDRNIVNVVDF